MSKEVLCYPCAVRMTTLWRMPAPPAPVGGAAPVSSAEDVTSAYRIVYPSLAPAVTDTTTTTTTTSSVSVCVACLGLYQFLDFVHSPLIAAGVRRSPYSDSHRLSVNVNVCRGFTFLWLHHAIAFYAGSTHLRDSAAGRVETATTSTTSSSSATTTASVAKSPEQAAADWQRSIATKVVPEEFSSFKDMYVSDMRARVLQYLTVPHAKVVASAAGAAGGSPLGLATYMAALADGETAGEEPDRKAAKTEGASSGGGGRGVVTCPQAFTEIDPVAVNGVIAGVEIRHPLTSLLADGHTCVPQQFCTNKQSSQMITYGTILQHASPFLVATQAEHLKRAAAAATAGGGGGVDGGAAAIATRATVLPVVSHTNIFIIGRYRKMLRGLSQSPWFAETGRVGSFSLQEVIAEPIIPYFFPNGVPHSVLPASVAKRQHQTDSGEPQLSSFREPRKCHGRLTGGLASPWQDVDPFEKALEQVFAYGRYKFHSAGREDVDVRMLGTGRPFVLEIVDPHRQTFGPVELAAMTDAVNAARDGAVEVLDLAFTTPDVTVTLARHSESKTKHYRCVVWSCRAIESDSDARLLALTQTKDLVVHQRTPLRVLHRRSLLDRPRTIHSVAAQRINSHWLIVDLETQAGTYIKEFVHGDMGRTLPSLGMLLGSRTDIVQLDVMGMVMEGEFLRRTEN